MLNLLHESHFGIGKTKARARELIYWPGISVDIEQLVSNCQICNKYMNAQSKEEMWSHDIPDLPFHKVAVDIFEIGPTLYLVLVDYFSKWVECVEIRSKSASEVIVHLKMIFSVHGIPVKVVADNNPFGSYEFKEFANDWNFEVINTSPLYPQSNGQIERTVQTVKKLVKSVERRNKMYTSRS